VRGPKSFKGFFLVFFFSCTPPPRRPLEVVHPAPRASQLIFSGQPAVQEKKPPQGPSPHRGGAQVGRRRKALEAASPASLAVLDARSAQERVPGSAGPFDPGGLSGARSISL